MAKENKKEVAAEKKQATEDQVRLVKQLYEELDWKKRWSDEELLQLSREVAHTHIVYLIDQKRMAQMKQNGKDAGRVFNESLFHMCRAAARAVMIEVYHMDPTVERDFYIRKLKDFYELDLEAKAFLKDLQTGRSQ